ncbi:MAG: hypothetical protein IKU38_03815 [Clostridia bacterium]|nr:hypothetical protein [Clostridia bacterium]
MLAALLSGLLYLFLCMPVSADLALESRGMHAKIRLCLRAWWLSMHINKPVGQGLDKKRAGEQAKRIRAKRKMIRSALRCVRWGQTDVHIRMGMGDAAQTAVFAGGLRAGAEALSAAAGNRFPLLVRIEPDFARPCLTVDARCIFSFVPGDIMLAVLHDAVRKNAGGEFRWKSIRLKA